MNLSITSPQHRDRTETGNQMLMQIGSFAHLVKPGELLHKPDFINRLRIAAHTDFADLVEQTSFLSVSRLAETISIHY